MFKNLRKSKYFKIGLMAFIVIAAGILTYFTLFKIGDIYNFFCRVIKILSPFILGFVFAYLLNPIVKFIKDKIVSKIVKKGNSKKLDYISLTIACIFVIAIVILLFSIILPELLKSIEKLAVNLPRYIEELKNYLLEKLSSTELKTMILNNYEAINNYLNNVVNVTLIPKIDEWLVALSSGVIGALKVIFDILMGFVIAIYYLADKDGFVSGVKKIIYAIFSIKTANRIIENARKADEVFSNFIVGRVLDGLIIGFITFLFLAIFGYPYALLIAVIVGLTNMIPYFGPWLGGIPSALLILMDNPTKGLIFILFILVLQQIDGYIIGPKLCGSKTGLKSFWVLASIVFFGNVFGVVGMIIGVPIFALIFSYLNNQLTSTLKEKELPLKKEDYLEMERINSETKKVIKKTK